MSSLESQNVELVWPKPDQPDRLLRPCYTVIIPLMPHLPWFIYMYTSAIFRAKMLDMAYINNLPEPEKQRYCEKLEVQFETTHKDLKLCVTHTRWNVPNEMTRLLFGQRWNSEIHVYIHLPRGDSRAVHERKNESIQGSRCFQLLHIR